MTSNLVAKPSRWQSKQWNTQRTKRGDILPPWARICQIGGKGTAQIHYLGFLDFADPSQKLNTIQCGSTAAGVCICKGQERSNKQFIQPSQTAKHTSFVKHLAQLRKRQTTKNASSGHEPISVQSAKSARRKKKSVFYDPSNILSFFSRGATANRLIIIADINTKNIIQFIMTVR